MTEYESLKAALATTGIPFAEDGWTQRPTPPYGVYAIDSQAASLLGSGDTQDMAVSGTVDLFTLDNVAELSYRVRSALRDACVSWSVNSYQYEDDTRLHHVEWAFELYMDPDEDAPDEDPTEETDGEDGV